MISLHEVSRVRTLFLQCVSLCYTIAFHSLYVQIPGLYGDHGILPARTIINKETVKSRSLWSHFSSSPSLLWFYSYTGLSVENNMEIICLVGISLGLLITLKPKFSTKLSFITLWLLYMSLYHVGQTFLHFQWDILLLETGMLAIIASPLGMNKHRIPLVQDSVCLYLIRWLLFRMMFASGVVKLTSGCDAWWGLTAMPTHYFSQCLPTPLAWFAAQMPLWLHKLSVLSTFIIEIPLTFLFFAPTSALRKLTFFNQIFLMIVIMLSGNYNFFNLLFIGLCLSLADDSWLSQTVKSSSHPIKYCAWCLFHLASCLILGWFIGQCVNFNINDDFTIDASLAFSKQDFDIFLSYSVPAGLVLGGIGLTWSVAVGLMKTNGPRSVTILAVYSAIAGIMFTLSLPSYAGQLDRVTYDKIPGQVKLWDRRLAHLELHHGYGLFRRMTGVGGRPEVVLEASDAVHGPWHEYDFMYKPGNLSVAPKFMLPHQPRLDWQMWFAALGNYQHNPWLLSLVYRLLEGRKEVLDLLDPSTRYSNRKPPKFIRAKLYKYHFAESETGNWWKREEQGEYLPILTVDNSQLVDILKNQGVIGPEDGAKDSSPSVIVDILKFLRNLSKQAPAELQIWSYSWLALSMFMPFLKPV